MKAKSVIILVLILFASTARSQYVTIPDTIFGSWLNVNGFAACMTGNNSVGWQIDTTCQAVLADTSMKLPDTARIRSVEGVQYFKSLAYFNCSGNLIATLPSLPPALVKLFCNSNNLSSLPPLPASLTQLFCSANSITNLPDLPTNLSSLFCNDNQLYVLPTLPVNLDYFNCSYNQLTALPAMPHSLSYFNCSNNLNLHCLPNLYRIVQFHFDSTAITCLPNTPIGNSIITPANTPICTSYCVFINGINDLSVSDGNLKIYPNPVTDKLYINYPSKDMTVSDVTGRVLMMLSSDSEINVSILPAGIYLLQIQNDSGSIVKRFVRE